MDYTDLSDLEEGEILEYESVSSSGSIRNEFQAETHPLNKRTNNTVFVPRESKNSESDSAERKKNGYINKRLKEKLELNEKCKNTRANTGLSDLESISSEGEYQSEKEDKYMEDETKTYRCSNVKYKKNRNHFYGTVEDIMSEIGETICRKTHCKRRKLKNLKVNLDSYSHNSYDVWRRKTFSSHIKGRKRKKVVNLRDSESDVEKERRQNRKRKKGIYHEKTGRGTEIRNFDEMRKSLLEKLERQKVEEKLKSLQNGLRSEVENSEIQEVDMLIDCTNYVDAPASGEGGVKGEKEGDEEMDLIQLRLIALASNKKRKKEEEEEKTEKAEVVAAEKSGETDLDRNELLLRAEALKTALLKKHQRRLNKLKIKRSNASSTGNSSNMDFSISLLEEGESQTGKSNRNVDGKENMEEVEGGCQSAQDPSDLDGKNQVKESSLISNSVPKKTPSKSKNKRKKRKSTSLGSNMKENNEKTSEAVEEDDRTLRSKLLSDLMKKKHLKDLENKSVLMDSVQKSVNKKSPSLETSKSPPLPPPSLTKVSLFKKVNLPKPKKPVSVPIIPKAEIQRIIIHLGSEDSSDEDGTSVPVETSVSPQQGKGEKQESAIKSSGRAEGEVQADYEKSVELLLSQARKNIEKKKLSANGTHATPKEINKAVYKHLPPSQRLEYIRLKQKIAEREKLKQQKLENSTTSCSVQSNHHVAETPSEKEIKSDNSAKLANSPSKTYFKSGTDSDSLNRTVFVSWTSKTPAFGAKAKEARPGLVVNNLEKDRGKGSRKYVAPKPENETKPAAPIQKNSKLLLPSSQALISKLKLLLRKIKMEKMIEENYEKEISKLKTQLSLFEKKKSEQRFKIKKLGEESLKTYKAIQGITEKQNEKPKESGEVQERKGQERDGENKPEAEAIDTKKKEEAEPEAKTEAETQPEGAKEAEGKNESDKPETEKAEMETGKELNNGNSETKEPSSALCVLDYRSPLQVFNKVSDSSDRVDPNVMMCPFDLMGVCKDEECGYQHLRGS